MDIKHTIYLVVIFLIGLFFGFTFGGDDSSQIAGDATADIDNYKNTISDLNEEIESLELDIIDLESQLVIEEDIVVEEKTEEEINSSVNLLNWNRDEIIEAMTAINPAFASGDWFMYIYRDDGKYYDQVGPIFEVDPFSEIAYSLRGDEFTVNAFRMFILNPDKVKAQSDYNDFQGEIIKETQLDKDLTCFQEDGCAGIKIVKCNKFGQNYHAWFEGNYLFTTRNDDGATLDTFETFYCQ